MPNFCQLFPDTDVCDTWLLRKEDEEEAEEEEKTTTTTKKEEIILQWYIIEWLIKGEKLNLTSIPHFFEVWDHLDWEFLKVKVGNCLHVF